MMSKCRGCGAEIIWALTNRGKHIPLDAKPEKRFVIVREADVAKAGQVDTYVSHFATCPKADQFRKEKDDA